MSHSDRAVLKRLMERFGLDRTSIIRLAIRQLDTAKGNAR